MKIVLIWVHSQREKKMKYMDPKGTVSLSTSVCTTMGPGQKTGTNLSITCPPQSVGSGGWTLLVRTLEPGETEGRA